MTSNVCLFTFSFFLNWLITAEIKVVTITGTGNIVNSNHLRIRALNRLDGHSDRIHRQRLWKNKTKIYSGREAEGKYTYAQVGTQAHTVHICVYRYT